MLLLSKLLPLRMSRLFGVIPETEERKNTAAFDLLDMDKNTTDDEKVSASLLSAFLVKVLRVAGYLKGNLGLVKL